MQQPDRFVLDASVAAKWFNNESLTDKAIEVRDAFVQGKIRLLAPAQMVYEVGNSIWKNKAWIAEAENAMNAISNLIDMEIESMQLNQEMAMDAMKIARDHSITFYDAAYIALADHFDATLISADDEILAKTKNKSRKENKEKPLMSIMHLKDFQI
ncbi:putative nucleic acid-binding protein, contains PIN domain [Candidatus Nitrososphaera evergladensis SR1]|uniref:Putative nucleic acid-binding protein, contains PIN domain n=1 Tax=Candidatus Nitrososphaera evergladensis SR1 TaxID=1459636 RepID=A0A075MNC3_9ARCH|nr:type II toxin-antitoxin system VapC family toxin [Candidatus Nitrososphaera evergladensis]AIF82307.1 putative nucleic acid-binding protein, contains PIN domain [Candidatus Nitrososphaera evergladensis SR1]